MATFNEFRTIIPHVKSYFVMLKNALTAAGIVSTRGLVVQRIDTVI